MTDYPSRRKMVVGTAWSIPAVAIASSAPAIASSPGGCANAATTISGGTRKVLSSTANPYVSLWGSSGGAATLPTSLQYSQPITMSDGSVVTMTITSSIIDTNSNDEQAMMGQRCGPATQCVNDTNMTQVSGGLQIATTTPIDGTEASSVNASGQKVVFSFTDSKGKAVSVQNISLTIDDIDTVTDGSTSGPRYWTDSVAIPGFSASSKGSNISGSGTSASPWMATTPATNASSSVNLPSQRVVATAAAPGSSFTMTYLNAGGTQSDQNIVLGAVSFSVGC